MKDKISIDTLLLHGTYREEEIREFQEVGDRVQKEGLKSLSLQDKIRFLNFFILTNTWVDERRSIWFTDESWRGWDDDSQELLAAILKDSKYADKGYKYRDEVGYSFSPAGGPSPFSSRSHFPLSSDLSYIDVGCGWGQEGLRVAEEVRCETYLLDPNAQNIRMAYHELEQRRLTGNEKIKLVLSRAQDAEIPAHCFDRAFMGSLAMPESTCCEVLETTLGWMKGGGLVTVVAYAEPLVSFPIHSQVEYDESYFRDEAGFYARRLEMRKKR